MQALHVVRTTTLIQWKEQNPHLSPLTCISGLTCLCLVIPSVLQKLPPWLWIKLSVVQFHSVSLYTWRDGDEDEGCCLGEYQERQTLPTTVTISSWHLAGVLLCTKRLVSLVGSHMAMCPFGHSGLCVSQALGRQTQAHRGPCDATTVVISISEWFPQFPSDFEVRF